MSYELGIKITVDKGKDNDRFMIVCRNTPYGTIYGEGIVLSEAIKDFDYNYVMAKEKHET